MSWKSLLPLSFAGVLLLGTGCNDSEETDSVATQPVETPVAVQSVTDLTPTQPPPPVVPPPGTPAPAVTQAMPAAIANDGSLASYVTPHASAYFQDREGQFEVKTPQELVERAIVAYREIQSTKHDDSPDWPVFNDLSLLVKYKILTALPPAPEGQSFVYDAATRKLSLASR